MSLQLLSRRVFGTFIIIAILYASANMVTAKDRPPNIVIFLADDLGYGDAARLNPDSKVPTPNMDRLADEGMLFRDAHSPSAVCSPTRYALLTGRYAWRTSLQQGVLRPWDPPLIAADRLTLPKMLKQHGYATACVGKWHLGWDWAVEGDRAFLGELRKHRQQKDVKLEDYARIRFDQPIANGPTTRGFDSYFGTAVPNYPPYCFIDDNRTVGIPTILKPADMFGNPGPMLPGWTLEPILPTLAARAVTFIDRHAAAHRDTPFFLYFASTAPHTPIVPDAPFVGKSDAGPYGDLVYQVDWTLGQILAALDRNGMAENTLVIMTSDNGSPARAGDPFKHGMEYRHTNTVTSMFGHTPNAPWRGMKADVWEAGHRVPMFVRWPKRIQAGTTSSQTVCHTDFIATVAKVIGHALPDDAAEDSVDLTPVLFGKSIDGNLREATVHHSMGGMFAIRQGRWKLIEGLGSGGWTQPRTMKPTADGPKGQLYDMQADPGETNNLWLEKPDVVQRLTTLLEKYKRDGRSVPHRQGA